MIKATLAHGLAWGILQIACKSLYCQLSQIVVGSCCCDELHAGTHSESAKSAHLRRRQYVGAVPLGVGLDAVWGASP